MTYFHTIECKDRGTRQIGNFIHAGDFVAISPVFGGLIELFRWMRDNGWQCIPYRHDH